MPLSRLGTGTPRSGTGAANRLRRTATELKTAGGTTETDSRSRCRTALTCTCNGQDAKDAPHHHPRSTRLPTPPLSPPRHQPVNRTTEGQPAAPHGAAERYALIAAGIVIVALTAGAFCLSYAHLADVAGQHGLGGSPVRRWAWPATLDAFIVAGELLMLRAALRRVTDRWAIAVTAIGSVGSIALNVAGVSGTRDTGEVPFLDYVVAAVPPAAAMVAFAILMRQIHQLVDQHPLAGSGQVLRASVTTSLRAAVSDGSPQPPAEVAETKSRGGRPPGPRSGISWRSAGLPVLSREDSPGPLSGRQLRTRAFRSPVSD